MEIKVGILFLSTFKLMTKDICKICVKTSSTLNIWDHKLKKSTTLNPQVKWEFNSRPYGCTILNTANLVHS